MAPYGRISVQKREEHKMERDFIFGCGEVSESGVCLPSARHDGCLEVLLVQEGTVTVRTSMCVFDAQAGDLVFLSPDMVRTVTAHGGHAKVRYVYFSASLFDGVSESIERDLLYMFLTQLRTRDNRVKPNQLGYRTLRTTLENCYDEFLSKELCYTLRIRGMLTMMMAELLSTYSNRRENDRMVYHNVLRLRPTLTYIAENYHSRISVGDLAEQILVTPDYYTKLFRDSIGKTTVDYINCERINHGMILLLETDLSVGEIAEKIGLGSGNYFSKLFKAIVGVSPLAYRKGSTG